MLKEAIEAIATIERTKQESRRINKFFTTADGRTDLFEHNGTIIERAVTPPTRSHVVDTVDCLVHAVGSQWSKKTVTLWLSHERVVALLDDDDRRDRVTLPLIQSDAWEFVESLSDGKSFTQPELIRLLRTTLTDIVGREALLTAIRKIKFRNHVSGVSDIQHGNESMGKTIENEVTGADSLPEAIGWPVYVYSNMGERDQRWPVALDLEIDAKNQKFRLQPVGDCLAAIKQDALSSIRGRLVDGLDKGISAFYGNP